MPDEKDEVIEAQRQVIGILFELVKRLQQNQDLDQEYLRIVVGGRSGAEADKLERIKSDRAENSLVIGRLLERLDD